MKWAVFILAVVIAAGVSVLAVSQLRANARAARLDEMKREKVKAVSDAETAYLESPERKRYMQALDAYLRLSKTAPGTEELHKAQHAEFDAKVKADARQQQVDDLSRDWDERIRNYEIGIDQ